MAQFSATMSSFTVICVYSSRSACIDPEVKRSKVKVTRLRKRSQSHGCYDSCCYGRCRRGSACRYDCLRFLVTHAGIAACVGRAFSRVCLFVCLFICLFVRALTGKPLELSTPNFGTRILYSSRSACIDPEVKRSRSHGYENRAVARLLVNIAAEPVLRIPVLYLWPLPAWVCTSIRLLMFSRPSF